VVALMLQANPNLTPNGVKAILQYTAQQYPGYKALEQGAGFLNAVGAVRLARFYKTAQSGARLPTQTMWSKHLIWGNHLISHGGLDVTANAFAKGTTWGVAQTDAGENIVWGTASSDENVVWGTAAPVSVMWHTKEAQIVWGTALDGENIVWGTSADGKSAVWGSAPDSNGNIIWGLPGALKPAWSSAPNGSQTALTGSQTFDRLKDQELLQLLEYSPPPLVTPVVTTITTIINSILIGGGF
jgi:hypothetical protein